MDTSSPTEPKTLTRSGFEPTTAARSTRSANVTRTDGHGALEPALAEPSNRSTRPQLFVRDWGSGPAVVLLAGWAMDSRVWANTMLALNAAGLRAIAVDRRGHGRSADAGPADYEALADDLAAVLEQLDVEAATIVAHSGAAGEAIRYVCRHGASRVDRLVLVGAMGPRMIAIGDGSPGIPRDQVDPLLARLSHDLAGWIAENARPFAPQADQLTLDWLSAMVLDASRRTVVDFQRVILEADLTASAAALEVPVTIIHGDQDVSAPLDLTARRYAALVPGAELLVYEGVAHGVMVTHAVRLAADVAARVRR